MCTQWADKIGVLDTTTDEFSAINVSGISPKYSGSLFLGAASVGDKVYLAPHVSLHLD